MALTPWDLHDWNVRKVPLIALDASGTSEVSGSAGVMRDDPASGRAVSLGVVGRHNNPIQNETQAELVMWILGTSTLDVLDAGYVGEGNEVFLVCDVPAEFAIDTGTFDAPLLHGPFELVSINHHDGSGALWFYVLPAGTWNAALRPLLEPFAKRHSGTRWIAEHSVARARVRHNASLRGIAGKLRSQLGLFFAGDGPLQTVRRS